MPPIPESLSSESESAKSLFKFSRLLLSGVAAPDDSVFSELVTDVEVPVPESIEFFFRLLISGEFKKLLTGLKDL